ncbi:MAG TPA: hypothetical protein VGF76_18760 [Polyangiaceae bacterium]
MPDGAEVAVVLGDTAPFDLGEDDVSELEARMTEADRGEVEPAKAVFDKLLARR